MKDLGRRRPQSKGVLLAQALFGNPRYLLLDEPTNHLDVETIGWLENFLADYENIVIVVSHDRHFLDAVCTHVADVDRAKDQDLYRQLHLLVRIKPVDRPPDRAIRTKRWKTNVKTLWTLSPASPRTLPNPKQATSRKKALEKLVIEDIEPSSRKYPGIIFKQLREVGNQILNVEKLEKSIDGRKLFSDVTFSVNKGDKIAFLSKDHLALSTFFDIINGDQQQDGGKLEWGTTVSKAYLPDDNAKFFTGNLNLMDWLRQYVPRM